MTPAAAAAPYHTPPRVQTPHPNSISQKKTQDAKIKKIILLCQWGYTGKNFYFFKNNFSLYVNGVTQERKYKFIKIIFHYISE